MGGLSLDNGGDRVSQRQRVCAACRSFVTHERNEDELFACPLCGNCLKPTPNLSKPVNVAVARSQIKEFYEQAYRKIQKQAAAKGKP